MPEPVVVVLEVVDIEEGDDAVLVLRKGLREDRLEALPVPESCQDIGEAHLEEPLLLAVVHELRRDEVPGELEYQTVVLIKPDIAPCREQYNRADGALDIKELDPYGRGEPAARGLNVVEDVLPAVMPHHAGDGVNLAEDLLLNLR